MSIRQSILALSLVCVVIVGPTASVRGGERDDVEAIGASLCKAVRSMDGEPILKSYSMRGGKLSMDVYWFGLLTGNKYTSTITINYGSSGKIDSIDYFDDCPLPKYDLVYVEKWRRAQNK